MLKTSSRHVLKTNKCLLGSEERWENSAVERSERREGGNEVATWGRWEGSEQGMWDGIQSTKLCCIAPGKRKKSRDSLQGFDNSYIMF